MKCPVEPKSISSPKVSDQLHPTAQLKGTVHFSPVRALCTSVQCLAQHLPPVFRGNLSAVCLHDSSLSRDWLLPTDPGLEEKHLLCTDLLFLFFLAWSQIENAPGLHPHGFYT